MADMIKGFSVNGEEYKVDYNSLGNKPFGVDTLVELIPITDIETSGDGEEHWSSDISIDSNNKPKIGDVCVVTFGGVEYEVTAFGGWGNDILLGELDNGVAVFDRYPFLLDFYSDSSYFALLTPTAGTYSVSIKKKDKTRIPLSVMPNELDVRNTYETFISADNLQFTNEGDYYQAQLFDGSKFVEAGEKYRVTIGSYSIELYSKLNQIVESENDSFNIMTNPTVAIMVSPDFYNEYHPASVVIERIVPNPIQTAKNTMVYAFNGGDSWGKYVNLVEALNYINQYGSDIQFYENKEQCDAANS